MFRRAASHGGFPLSGHPAPPTRVYPPLPPTASGYVPGSPIIATPGLREGLTRLQAGQTQFDVEGMQVGFSGIPDGTHNVLRDLQESPLGQRANQLEAMTIEMVAMLFDFIFDTRDLPDGIKALLARLQIPVLKVAMLDGAFFARKTHPSRLLVNALAAAGLGWSPAMGRTTRCTGRSSGSCTGSSTDSATTSASSTSCARSSRRSSPPRSGRRGEFRDDRRGDQRRRPARISRASSQNPKSSGASKAIRSRASSRSSCARNGMARSQCIYLRDGDDSEAWGSSVATLEDLVWSVQPKKTPEDRKHLVALLPSLLKRLAAGRAAARNGAPGEREAFMSNLVEAHAAAVKPSLATVPSPTAAVAEAARAEARSGEGVRRCGSGGARRSARGCDGAGASPSRARAAAPVLEDEYLEIARSLDRGMWVEFEDEDAQLSFAKLAWISPLRGTYLFTNRQGQKALSMTAEELADRFRANRARLVEAEPLIDRAFTSVHLRAHRPVRARNRVGLNSPESALAAIFAALRRALPILALRAHRRPRVAAARDRRDRVDRRSRSRHGSH